jgi:hypothetical protein
MRATESKLHQHVSTGDTPNFMLNGGIYQVVAVGFTTGSATIYELGPDATTWLCVHDAFTANGGDTIYLPPGLFKWTVVGEADISLSVTRVPGE